MVHLIKHITCYLQKQKELGQVILILEKKSIDTLLKLFESTIKPILLYCSEIWGGFLNEFKKNKIEQLLINNKHNFEKLQIMFCSQPLG